MAACCDGRATQFKAVKSYEIQKDDPLGDNRAGRVRHGVDEAPGRRIHDESVFEPKPAPHLLRGMPVCGEKTRQTETQSFVLMQSEPNGL